MNVDSIKQLLWDYGHFRNPLFKGGASWNIEVGDLASLTLTDKAFKEAIQSYQQFMVGTLEPLSLAIHSRPSIADGEIGPATEKLFTVERCAVPDYGMSEEEAGAGSWPHSCLPNWNGVHAVTVNVNISTMPAFLQGRFNETIWPAVVFGYSQIGLLLVREDGNSKANLQASWVSPDGGWIGLAIIPGTTSCSLSIWARFSKFYQGTTNSQISLWMHELGHNMRLQHSRGGIMNPTVTQIVSWKGDPSEPILKRYFGGIPVNVPTPEPEMWVKQGLKSNKGRELWVDLHPPRIAGTS
jgi:hypothetical protein